VNNKNIARFGKNMGGGRLHYVCGANMALVHERLLKIAYVLGSSDSYWYCCKILDR
jgi:hypothetical protein